MFALMLDPRFEPLKVVENYVGHGAYIHLVTKYDSNAIILLLMIMFEVLNPFVQACTIEVVGYVVGFGDFIKEKNNISGVGASMEKSSHGLIFGELSLFKRLSITPTTSVDPLT
jgi:hypothetical protein